jgi:DDE family transposase
MASVPPRYRRFFALTDPAATLWPSVAVAGAYLAPGYFSPGPGGLHQFQCNPSLRAAVLTPPESVAAISQRSSAPDAAFAVPLAARLPEFIITGLAQRSIPAARSVTPQPHRRVRQEVPRRAFATPTRLLSFTAPWPLPCRDFHSLGCTAFLLVTQWNKIEHRMFSHISQNWRGRPLVDHETVVSLIANTRTKTGLKVRSRIDKRVYPLGTKITDAAMADLALHRHDFHGDWNYTLTPRS